jgi:hypothetical protein
VAGECALKLVVSKTKGTRRGGGSMGKRKAVGWHFVSSSAEHRRAIDSGAQRDGTRSGGGSATGWKKGTAAFRLDGPSIRPQTECCWAGAIKLKGKSFRAAKRTWAEMMN